MRELRGVNAVEQDVDSVRRVALNTTGSTTTKKRTRPGCLVLCVMEGSEMKSSPICPAVVTYCAANEIPQQPCPCLLTAKPVPVGGVVWLAATAVFRCAGGGDHQAGSQ